MRIERGKTVCPCLRGIVICTSTSFPRPGMASLAEGLSAKYYAPVNQSELGRVEMKFPLATATATAMAHRTGVTWGDSIYRWGPIDEVAYIKDLVERRPHWHHFVMPSVALLSLRPNYSSALVEQRDCFKVNLSKRLSWATAGVWPEQRRLLIADALESKDLRTGSSCTARAAETPSAPLEIFDWSPIADGLLGFSDLHGPRTPRSSWNSAFFYFDAFGRRQLRHRVRAAYIVVAYFLRSIPNAADVIILKNQILGLDGRPIFETVRPRVEGVAKLLFLPEDCQHRQPKSEGRETERHRRQSLAGQRRCRSQHHTEVVPVSNHSVEAAAEDPGQIVAQALTIFISYTQVDRAWAEWIAWQLEEEAGHKAIVQAWDFTPGSNFVIEMQRALSVADCTIAVLSPAYLEAHFPEQEWAAAFNGNSKGRGKLIPVRVEQCELPPLLAEIVYIDLVGKDEQAARKALLAGVLGERQKPDVPPQFPGRPQFPGGAPAAAVTSSP